jgi:transposase InsO family protein
MLDTGCSRTVISRSSLPSSTKIVKSNVQLLCANEQRLQADTTEAPVRIEFNSDLTEILQPLVTDTLSCDIIIGVDCLRDFSYRQNDQFALVNGVKVTLIRQDSPFRAARLQILCCEPFRAFPPNSTSWISLRNPHHNSKLTHVSIDPFDKPKEQYKSLLIQPAIAVNNKSVEIPVRNLSDETIYVKRNAAVCKISPFKIEQVNGLTTVPDIETEMIKTEQFQENRQRKAEEIGFKPEIENYGDVSEEEREILEKLIMKYRLCFSMDESDLGCLAKFRFTLPQKDEQLDAYEPPRPPPIHLRQKVKDVVENWQELGIIRETQSSYNIPLIILKKGDGSIRVSLDARKLNALLVQDRFPLPSMSEAFVKISDRLAKAGGKCYVTALDWFRGYWSLQVDRKDRRKLAFSYDNRHYEATRMLYGTSTGPAAFSRVMSELFASHPSIYIYLDDVLVIDQSFEEHVKTLTFIFEKCLEYGILMSARKLKLCRASFDFLGHKITSRGIQPTDKHVNTIKNFPAPTDRTGIKRFLGLVNFNLKFVRNGSKILNPLYKLTSKSKEFKWEEEQQHAFETIKEQLITTPGLGHFDKDKPLTLVTDSSGHAVGGTLYQTKGNDLIPIGYFSRHLNGPDQRRSMRQKELLAVAYSIKSFEYYLIGKKFDLVVDHKSLIYLFKEKRRKDLCYKFTNIFHYLLNFEFNILHHPGESAIMASSDCLSRLEKKTPEELEKESEQEDIPDTVFTMAHLPETFKEETPQNIQNVIYGFLGKKPETEKEPDILLRFGTKTLARSELEEMQLSCFKTNNLRKKTALNAKRTRKFKVVDGVLYKLNANRRRLVIPEPLCFEFISHAHSSMGHPGYHQMTHLLRKVFIHGGDRKLRELTARCPTCIRVKPRKAIRPGALKQKYFESSPFQKTHIDLVDFNRKDCEQKRYFMSFVDSLTGYCDGVALSSKSDGVVAKGLLTLILRNGASNAIVSDNGGEFCGPAVQNLFKKFNLRHCRTSAYYSRSNTVAERTHREINKHLRLLDASASKWSLYLPEALFYCNQLPKSSLDGLSAFECIYGRSFLFPFTINETPTERPLPFQKALQNYLNELHPALLQYQMNRHEWLLKGEKKAKIPVLEIGDKCLVYRPDLQSGKLTLAWHGPYEILYKRSEHSYALRHLKTNRIFHRHISHLRPLQQKPFADVDEKQENVAEPDDAHQLAELENAPDIPFSDYFLRSRKRREPKITEDPIELEPFWAITGLRKSRSNN